MAIIAFLVCLFSGIATLLAFKSIRQQRYLSVLGSAVLLVVSVLMLSEQLQGSAPWVMQMGAWQAPIGITFYVDLFSVIMIFISAFIALGVNIYSLGATSDIPVKSGFHPIFHFMMMGVVGSFCTADLFNLYVWFEVLLLGSFGLMALSEGTQAIKGLLKYVILNLVGSAFFLLGLGILYASAGTLNFADLVAVGASGAAGGLVPVVGVMLLVAFLMKAGAFPFFQWLPSSYPSVEISALAIFSGLLTKVGVYVIVRFFAGGFPMPEADLKWLLAVSAGFTMILGVWGAAVQMAGRQILSFHIISQIGYILMGVASLTLGGIAAAIFYLIHHMVVKTNLFLVMGWLQKNYGGDRLAQIGEIAKRHPWIAVGFAIPALSLAGIPPLSGFWAKLLVVQSAVQTSSFVLVGVSLFVGVLTLYSMLKIWNEAFLKAAPEDMPVQRIVSRRHRFAMGLPIAIFCIWTIVMGVNPDYFLSIAKQAAAGVLDSEGLRQRVLVSAGEK